MSTTKHVADITDPVTGQTTTLTAATEAELAQLIDDHLHERYPQQETTPTS